VLRLLAKHYENGDIDKFTSDEVSKIICALAESSSSSTILGPSISDELEQHIQSLLKDEKT
jgi:predicted ATP-binding protein involved in virulence